MNMEVCAYEYWREHRKGRVVDVTDYSFTWETLPDEDGKTKQTVFYESFFTKI